MPVTVVEEPVYASALPRARELIAQRDADDVDVLALALHTRLPLSSNDNDFEDTGIEWCTTAELLKRLGRRTGSMASNSEEGLGCKQSAATPSQTGAKDGASGGQQADVLKIKIRAPTS
ncbi:MAG: PIN domain-containing protein [Terriglobales bacterium]